MFGGIPLAFSNNNLSESSVLEVSLFPKVFISLNLNKIALLFVHGLYTVFPPAPD